MDIVPPDAEQISHIMAQATAPAFMLGAVAGLISILSLRLNGIFDRIRNVKAIAPENISRAQRDSDVSHLKRRAALLHKSIRLALGAGICTALLLMLGFATAFVRLRHEYGAAVLFVFAVGLIATALFRFMQEVKLALSELDDY
jgi:hypothetical protein